MSSSSPELFTATLPSNSAAHALPLAPVAELHSGIPCPLDDSNSSAVATGEPGGVGSSALVVVAAAAAALDPDPSGSPVDSSEVAVLLSYSVFSGMLEVLCCDAGGGLLDSSEIVVLSNSVWVGVGVAPESSADDSSAVFASEVDRRSGVYNSEVSVRDSADDCSCAGGHPVLTFGAVVSTMLRLRSAVELSSAIVLDSELVSVWLLPAYLFVRRIVMLLLQEVPNGQITEELVLAGARGSCACSAMRTVADDFLLAR